MMLVLLMVDGDDDFVVGGACGDDGVGGVGSVDDGGVDDVDDGRVVGDGGVGVADHFC